jgi:hypothetical protein
MHPLFSFFFFFGGAGSAPCISAKFGSFADDASSASPSRPWRGPDPLELDIASFLDLTWLD